MSTSPSAIVAYRFGPFRLIVAGRILERDGERVQLTPKVIDTLFVLVENARQVVTKESLMKQVWPDVTVVESGLTRNISALRKAIEADQPEGSILETIPRRGYRFLADVEVETEAPERIEVQPVANALGTPPAEAPPQRRRWIGPVSISAVAAVLILGWYAWRPLRPRELPEPEVRIGEHLLRKAAPEESVRAQAHFEKAIAVNPQSAGGHAGLAAALLQSSMLGVQPLGETLPRAETLARRAIELDDRSAMAHFAIGFIHIIKDWNFAAGRKTLLRSLELDPRLVLAWIGYSRMQVALNELTEAQRSLEEALRIDPASPQLGTDYCQLFYFQRDFRRAEFECRQVLEREPGYALAGYVLALSLGMLGRFDDAETALSKTAILPGVVEVDRAWLSLRRGDRRPALALLESRRQSIREGDIDNSAKLLLATMLDRRDEAIEALEDGLSKRAPELLTIAVEPRLDPLRTDPRYAAALQRAGFAVR